MIRKATLADVPAICSLISENSETLLPRDEQNVRDLIEAFFVSEVSGKVVGCCCLEIYSSKIAEIRSVAVATPFRQEGHGTALVEAAVKEAQARDILEIMVVTSSLEFFGRLGFHHSLNEKYALFWTGKK